MGGGGGAEIVAPRTLATRAENLRSRAMKISPLSPPSAPLQRRLQGHPTKSNFLAVKSIYVLVCFCLTVPILLTSLACSQEEDTPSPGLEGFYVHPKASSFTNLKFQSPLPEWFVKEYPKRKMMGDQYLQILGNISIVGESADQIDDMKKIAHALLGFVDSNEDGKADDPKLWNKYIPTLKGAEGRLVLYVTKEKQGYKRFDSMGPSLYDQAWSTNRDGEKLHTKIIMEELFHFLQNVIWSRYDKKSFGMHQKTPSVVAEAAHRAVRDRYYVYDEDCISSESCLLPEFFFCVMTDVLPGWPKEGAPGISEWTLKGQPQAIEKNFSKMLAMVKKLQKQGRMPLKWPRP